MSFTDLFIKRPVVATVVNLIIFIAGYQAIRRKQLEEPCMSFIKSS
jgi:multidrug efflux pump subunit AcrB